mmetsp:Transcript_25289/g.48435  ORF Transcript_25289/g.48435 Transcript_25289/m.48435 type:complete len:150 (+) Transcript_25289:364-813(+)
MAAGPHAADHHGSGHLGGRPHQLQCSNECLCQRCGTAESICFAQLNGKGRPEPDAICHSVIVIVVEKGADWQMALALLAATSHVSMDPDIISSMQRSVLAEGVPSGSGLSIYSISCTGLSSDQTPLAMEQQVVPAKRVVSGSRQLHCSW